MTQQASQRKLCGKCAESRSIHPQFHDGHICYGVEQVKTCTHTVTRGGGFYKANVVQCVKEAGHAGWCDMQVVRL